MTRTAEQAPFEIKDSGHLSSDTYVTRISQCFTESRRFSSSTPVSSHSECSEGGFSLWHMCDRVNMPKEILLWTK